jgi:hypothetical protein
MTKQAMRAALAGVLLLGVFAQSARAGTWEHTFFAADFELGNGLGTATRATDGRGNTYISFSDTGSQTATAKLNLPSFLTDPPLLTCYAVGRTSSVDATRNWRFSSMLEYTPLSGGTLACGNATSRCWSDNDGVTSVGATDCPGPGAQSDATCKHPPTTANYTFFSNNMTYTTGGTPGNPLKPIDQVTDSACTTIATCGGPPARFLFERLHPNSDPPAAFELIKVVCTAPTN